MKRFLFYLIRFIAFLLRAIKTKYYMRVLMFAHKLVGVKFIGKPEYIQYDAFLDASGGLSIEKNVVISTRVIILSHDWSFLKKNYDKQLDLNKLAYKPVLIKENSFIGAGAILLPGTVVGKNCIIGAGAVVKGLIPDYSIVIGNPSKIIGTLSKS